MQKHAKSEKGKPMLKKITCKTKTLAQLAKSSTDGIYSVCRFFVPFSLTPPWFPLARRWSTTPRSLPRPPPCHLEDHHHDLFLTTSPFLSRSLLLEMEGNKETGFAGLELEEPWWKADTTTILNKSNTLKPVVRPSVRPSVCPANSFLSPKGPSVAAEGCSSPQELEWSPSQDF